MITDKKSKVFLTVFAFIVMLSVVATHYRYIVIKNFDFFADEETFNELLLEE